MGKINIKELDLEELKQALDNWQEPHFRAQQILSWIYQKGVTDFTGMSNLSLTLSSHTKVFYIGISIIS